MKDIQEEKSENGSLTTPQPKTAKKNEKKFNFGVKDVETVSVEVVSMGKSSYNTEDLDVDVDFDIINVNDK